MRELALELLTEFGTTVVLTRAQDGAVYDPGAGTFSGGDALELNGRGVFLDYTVEELRGTDIESTDKKMIYQGDALEIGDVRGGFRVYKPNPLDPDESGTIVAFVQMRR